MYIKLLAYRITFQSDNNPPTSTIASPVQDITAVRSRTQITLHPTTNMVSEQCPFPGPAAHSHGMTDITIELIVSPPMADTLGLQHATSSTASKPIYADMTSTNACPTRTTPPATPNHDPLVLIKPQSNPAPTLPSLLRYVEHHLMQTVALHNRPPHPAAICPVCETYWNSLIKGPKLAGFANPNPAATSSTFLPLTPCKHWLHYRCLIARACDPSNPFKDRCPVCNVQIYQWDGITALTVATRTGFTLFDTNPRGRFGPADELHPCLFQPSDTAEYISECLIIDNLIHHVFFEHLGVPSKYADGSPDLVQAYYDVLTELDKRNLPKAKWLRWSTQTGSLLFGMLVVIKMRRFLVEEQGGIMRTVAWNVFEEGGRELQKRILGEIHEISE